MKKMSLFMFPLVMVSLVACGPEGKPAGGEAPGAAQVATEGGGRVLANLNGTPITEDQVRSKAGAQYAQAEMKLYDIQKEVVDQIISDKLIEGEAKKRGKSADEVLKAEVFEKVNIADKDIKKFYDENKERLGGKPLDEAKGTIRGHLFRQQQEKLNQAFIQGLRKKNKVELLVKAPTLEVPEGGAPAIGPEDAKVRIVEFSDYQCPFCGRARATVNKINEEYKGKVRYVFRDFPLSFHQYATKAHEAAHCAGDQGKYWEMSKKLFEKQQALKPEDLKSYAQEIKLNTKKFDECLDGGKASERVQKGLSDGSSIGVSGTPAYFINGRMISGARPFEDFKQIIDDELGKDS